MAKSIDIVVPDLGDFADVEVIEIIASAGDRVEQEDGLVTLETDKAAMDVPAPENGTIEAITIAVGDTVSTGSVIGRMSVEESSTVASKTPAAAVRDEPVPEAPAVEEAAAPAPVEPPPRPEPSAAAPQPAVNEPGFSRAHASPSVRKRWRRSFRCR